MGSKNGSLYDFFNRDDSARSAAMVLSISIGACVGFIASPRIIGLASAATTIGTAAVVMTVFVVGYCFGRRY